MGRNLEFWKKICFSFNSSKSWKGGIGLLNNKKRHLWQAHQGLWPTVLNPRHQLCGTLCSQFIARLLQTNCFDCAVVMTRNEYNPAFSNFSSFKIALFHQASKPSVTATSHSPLTYIHPDTNNVYSDAASCHPAWLCTVCYCLITSSKKCS